jgi:phage terminase large subunit GpA-like protein
MAQPMTLLIDSGNRADEVYQFALSDPERIKPTKGSNTRLSWPVQKTLQKRSGVILWNIDTEKTKDLLNRLMSDPDPSSGRFTTRSTTTTASNSRARRRRSTRSPSVRCG